MDKARAAATDLAAKADTALASSGTRGQGSGGDADRYFRDLGVLAYLEADGRSASPEERERVMETLRGMEARGAIGTLALHTAAPPPPGGAAPPPPSAGTVPPPPGGTVAPAPPPPTAPAPPPPSWMTKDQGS